MFTCLHVCIYISYPLFSSLVFLLVVNLLGSESSATRGSVSALNLLVRLVFVLS